MTRKRAQVPAKRPGTGDAQRLFHETLQGDIQEAEEGSVFHSSWSPKTRIILERIDKVGLEGARTDRALKLMAHNKGRGREKPLLECSEDQLERKGGRREEAVKEVSGRREWPMTD